MSAGLPGARAPLLTLQAACVSFGSTRALQDVNLSLARGERLALVGANGSGKTTLLRRWRERLDGGDLRMATT